MTEPMKDDRYSITFLLYPQLHTNQYEIADKRICKWVNFARTVFRILLKFSFI